MIHPVPICIYKKKFTVRFRRLNVHVDLNSRWACKCIGDPQPFMRSSKNHCHCGQEITLGSLWVLRLLSVNKNVCIHWLQSTKKISMVLKELHGPASTSSLCLSERRFSRGPNTEKKNQHIWCWFSYLVDAKDTKVISWL